MGINDPSDLRALRKVLSLDNKEKRDIAVVCVDDDTTIEERTGKDTDISDRVTDVFSEVVFSAEKAGKPVKLLALKGSDATRVLLEAAACLHASQVWISSISSIDSHEQERLLQQSWKSLDTAKPNLSVSIVCDSLAEPQEICLNR